MNYMLWLSIMGGLASIISFIISMFRENKNSIKIILISCFVLFTLTSMYISHLVSEMDRIDNIEKSASTLVNEKYKFSDTGFVYAGLSFLETNKDIYPDTYKRAIKIANDMEESESVIADSKAANTMRGVLYGIAIQNREK